eukprot:5679842-Prymnesium_polylepis.1
MLRHRVKGRSATAPNSPSSKAHWSQKTGPKCVQSSPTIRNKREGPQNCTNASSSNVTLMSGGK